MCVCLNADVDNVFLVSSLICLLVGLCAFSVCMQNCFSFAPSPPCLPHSFRLSRSVNCALSLPLSVCLCLSLKSLSRPHPCLVSVLFLSESSVVFTNSTLTPHPHRLVGLVVRRPPRERKVPGSNPACAGIFSGSSHTSDLNIGTPVATLPGAWRYRVSAGTGRPGVSIL